MKAAQRPRILRTSAAALLAMVTLGSAPAGASTLTWTGAGTTWTPTADWISTPVAGFTPITDNFPSDLVFSNTLTTTSTNDNNTALNGAVTLNSITFTPTAKSYLLNGEPIIFQGGSTLTNNSSALQVLSFATNPVAFNAGIELTDNNFSAFPIITSTPTITWTAASGDILVTSDITFSSSTPTTVVTLVIDGSHNTTLTGAITDQVASIGSLVKNGTGTLLLTGQSTYSGDTTVNGGVLRVDGSIASARTFVNAGGTLGGTGFIGGNVYNSGNVQPGDAPGKLTVKGNYFQGSGGTLTIEVAGKNPGQFSVLAVQGHANLDGNLRIVQVGSGAPRLSVGQHLDIVTATGGVSGQFANVSNPLLNTGTIVQDQVVYHSNTVSIEGVQGSFAGLNGLTPNQESVAKALDHAAFHNKAPKLIGYLDNQSLGNLPGDFDKIAPEELTSVFTIGTALANVQTANLQRRTDDIRSGSHGFSAAGFATAGSGPLYSGNAGVAGPSGDDGKESKEMKTVAPPEDRWGVFITGVGEWVSVGDDFNARGYDINTGGFTVGADYKVTPNFAVGLDAGYAGTGADLNNGGRVFVNSGKLGLYATYFTGGFYIDTAVNGGYNSYDMHRDALQGTAHSSTDGGELNVLFGTGYDWKMGGFSIGPTASFQYTYLGISDFSESGSLAPLRFPSQHQDSTRTALGMKASYDWKVGGVVVKPEVSVAWQHEYGDNSYALGSSFEGGNLFNVNGPVIGRDSVLVGAGFAIMWNERTSTYVYYDGDLGASNYNSQNVSGGIRISF